MQGGWGLTHNQPPVHSQKLLVIVKLTLKFLICHVVKCSGLTLLLESHPPPPISVEKTSTVLMRHIRVGFTKFFVGIYNRL